MANRRKRFLKAYAEQQGLSYQAAAHASENELRVFHAPGYSVTTSDGMTTDYGVTTFSRQCPPCARWIHCGVKPRSGVCYCGARYRVIFVKEEDWALRRGPLCMDCGCESKFTEPHEGRNPWYIVNEWQQRCHRCHQRHLAHDTNTARPGYVLVKERDYSPVELPSAVRCVLCLPAWYGWPYLVERVRGGKSILMTSDDPAIADRYPGEIITLGQCAAGDEVFGGHWNHPPGEARLWTPLKILAVGEVGPNVTTMATLEKALRTRSLWTPNLVDVPSVKAHLLQRFATFDPRQQVTRLAMLDEIVHEALRGSVSVVVTLIDRLAVVSPPKEPRGFTLYPDYETAARAGAAGTFQVEHLIDEHGEDVTHLVDQGVHFHEIEEFERHLARRLNQPVAVAEGG